MTRSPHLQPDLQPTIGNGLVAIRPLNPDDFEPLYSLASDPLVWEQHPNRNRYRREVFENYFQGALESRGAFFVSCTESGEPVGCSRYYGYDKAANSITIGYTFVGRKFWGCGYNPALKKLMIGHAFRFTERVMFHIGACNIRSQKAIERLGAKKTDEIEMAYYGEANALNFVYQIEKKDWLR